MKIINIDQYNLYQELVTDVLKQAKSRGASAADALASASMGLAVNVRKQEVDTIEFDRSKGLGITVYFGIKKGSASTSDFSPQSLAETVDKACSLAKLMAEDQYCGLADPDLLAYDYKNLDLDLVHPWLLDPEQAKTIALECEQYGLNYSNKITNSDGTDVNTHTSLAVYGNSNNFIGGYEGSRHSISCVLIAAEQDKMQRDHWYSVSRVANQLEQVKIIGQTAAAKAIARLNPRSVTTQQANVLFSPEMARGLFASFVSAISGGSLYRESTFLLNKLDQKIFSDLITITDDPYIKQGLGSSFFDSEGVKPVKRDLVSNGILMGYVLSSYSARRLGLKTTGNAGGTYNLLIRSNAQKQLTQQEIIKNISKGLLVTELMGQGINLVTGDYSRGASGFWIENGEIVYPVEGVTIAGNLKDMFLGITAVGSDIDKRSSTLTGSVLIDSMMIAGS
jgi:PmbA protein